MSPMDPLTFPPKRHDYRLGLRLPISKDRLDMAKPFIITIALRFKRFTSLAARQAAHSDYYKGTMGLTVQETEMILDNIPGLSSVPPEPGDNEQFSKLYVWHDKSAVRPPVIPPIRTPAIISRRILPLRTKETKAIHRLLTTNPGLTLRKLTAELRQNQISQAWIQKNLAKTLKRLQKNGWVIRASDNTYSAANPINGKSSV